MFSGTCLLTWCPKCKIYFASLGIKAAHWAAKLQPNSSQLTNYFSSLVWWANYFNTTTAKLHPSGDWGYRCIWFFEIFSWWGSGLGTSSAWFAVSSYSLRAFNILNWIPLHIVNLTEKWKCWLTGWSCVRTSSWTSQSLKYDLKNELFGSGLQCEEVFSPKSWRPKEYVNVQPTRLSLKTRLSLYLMPTKKKI